MRWQTVGISLTGFSKIRMRGQIGAPHSAADHLVQRLQVIGIVYERSRSGRSRKTTPRENRLIARCARRNRFATSARIRDELNIGVGVCICKDC